MKKNIISLFLLFISFSTHAQQIYLQEYVKVATDSNPGLQAVYKKYEMSLQRVPQVGTLPNPTVSFAYGGRLAQKAD